MVTRLDRLLDDIHPRRIVEKISRRVDEAVNSFPIPVKVTEWGCFMDTTMRFCRHVETRILNLEGDMPDTGPTFNLGRYMPFLTKAFGQNAEKTAFEMARTGNEGGCYAVLRKVAQVLAEEYAQNEIRARVACYWNGLSVEEKLAAGDEYLDKYGHLLPWELTEGSATRVRANLPAFLEEHPRMLQRLGQVGRG
jgi:hypothetical protein